MANEQDFRFNVGDGWLDVTHSEPGNSWVVAYGPFERECNTGGPWLSTANPRMPTEGSDNARPWAC